ncbi:peptide/nickel transport system substrate-binding protein [Rhizobium sp. RU35A]|uniref:ABC transporter substrate-binding protein n=1 Tax=Rhizobium sp. RU35A TaxID=1907414 RepID=UPI000954756A|nr:ABC transporter substrate-binding protein [Rhizobium sp. RU35A]SIQ45693.1 peptide/nickel transport system substrate-binding protein [Rhizobium sp. RU35A]
MTSLIRILATGCALLCGLAAAQAAPPPDTLVVGLSADASTFDPAQISSRDNANIAKHIFATLYTVNFEGEIKPYLADKTEVSADGLSYLIKIKPNLTCDNGEALTAEDVAYSFNRPADKSKKFTGNSAGFVFPTLGFKSAEVVDDLTVRINLSARTTLALGMMAQIYIHCKDAYEAMTLEQASTNPVGSGSYRLVSWQRGSQIVLEKVKDPGRFKRIVWRIIPEASTRTAELIAGNVDIITNVSPDQIGAIDASGTAAVEKVSGTRRMQVGYNLSPNAAGMPGAAEIQNPKVRFALQYAVDVPGICSQLLGTTCERATSLVNPPNGNPDLKAVPYDPAMAEKLLDEAGYPRGADGVRFHIRLQGPRGRYLNDANVVQAIGQYLTDVGVQTDVELLEWASVYSPLLRAKKMAPLFFLGQGGVTWNPLYDMSLFSTPDATTNYQSWTDPRWFDDWKLALAAPSVAEARPVINRMLKLFYEEGPWLQLYFQPDFYGVSKRVAWKPRRDEEIDLFDASLK